MNLSAENFWRAHTSRITGYVKHKFTSSWSNKFIRPLYSNRYQALGCVLNFFIVHPLLCVVGGRSSSVTSLCCSKTKCRRDCVWEALKQAISIGELLAGRICHQTYQRVDYLVFCQKCLLPFYLMSLYSGPACRLLTMIKWCLPHPPTALCAFGTHMENS